EGLRGRVFTTIGLGSYVTWDGWPDLTTSIDSRLELFGGDFLAEHLEATRDREWFERFSSRWTFDFALLPWRLPSVSGALASLEADQRWALVYFDDLVVLYARRTSETGDWVERHAYKTLDPVRFLAHKGFAQPIDVEAARREAERATRDPMILPGGTPANP